MKEKFNFHEDPGHGWLEVPFRELVLLGIAHKISEYSYRRWNTCYLEEDCDANVFLKAMKEAGREVELVFVEYRTERAPLLQYPGYWI